VDGIFLPGYPQEIPVLVRQILSGRDGRLRCRTLSRRRDLLHSASARFFV
jgi:hypothetical protein